MENEALRKQIEAEFETQLREVKSQKKQLEVEFEEASDRWRTERRRLNSEVDRLEDQLASAKKGGGGGGGSGADTQQIEKAFEEKFQKAAAEWQTERERLINQISRLEQSVTDTISRSSNPLRATQAIKDEYEAKLAEANKQRFLQEQDFLRIKVDAEEEKRKLMAELIKLRRMTPPNLLQKNDEIMRLYGRGGTLEDARIHELEGQLSEARARTLKDHSMAMQMSGELADARRELQQLKNNMAEIREQITSETTAQLRREFEAEIQTLSQQNARLTRQRSDDGSGSEDDGAMEEATVSGTVVETGSIDDEVNRVQNEIKAIEKLVDDPDISASTMARKSEEKAELEAYLRGILFSTGRS